MKFAVATFLAALATLCLGQSIDIGAPANGTSVTPGSTLVVEVDQPDSLGPGFIEIAVVIGIGSCPSSGCPSPGGSLGTDILYNGPYNPQFHPSPGDNKPPYQNFTVTIPSTLTTGALAELSVFHVLLSGLANEPMVQTVATTLNVD